MTCKAVKQLEVNYSLQKALPGPHKSRKNIHGFCQHHLGVLHRENVKSSIELMFSVRRGTEVSGRGGEGVQRWQVS